MSRNNRNRPFPPIRCDLFRVLLALAGLALIMSGCATPVSVERVDPRSVHRELTSNVLSTGELSNPTRIVLNQTDLFERFEQEPEQALAALHAEVTQRQGDADDVFALAELSFMYAENSDKRAYYLASAVYAFAFLFPGEADAPPNPFDPRLRVAADLHNRGITAGFALADGGRVGLDSGIYPLPFGELEVTFDPAELHWADRELVDFVPVADLEIRGLRNRYRQAGIGAPLAAGTVPLHREQDFQDFVSPGVKVPVTALLRIKDARRQLSGHRVHASLELYPATGADTVLINGRDVPLEAEPTAALAFALSQSPIWKWEYLGFLFGDPLTQQSMQLVALEPYQPGRIPVVFVHGTVASPGRWANMFNDLQNDPRIGDRFQFWFFFYNTGNPIPFSALQLRDALSNAVEQLDPAGRDPALRRMVVIGHSQGGLLTKLTAVDSGTRLWDSISRKPLDELNLQPKDRELLRRALFIEPLPFVRRVIFIATPHRGSYVAGSWISQQVARLVKLPGRILTTVADTITRNPEAFPSLGGRIGSIYGMTPGNPGIKALAAIPVAPGVAAHSIIAVKGDGPVEEGSDGVVKYSSAHIAEVDSELVVRSGHSVQSTPQAIEEVRRILLLDAASQSFTGIQRLH